MVAVAVVDAGGWWQEESVFNVEYTNEFRQKLLKLINCIKSLGQTILVSFVSLTRSLSLHFIYSIVPSLRNDYSIDTTR